MDFVHGRKVPFSIKMSPSLNWFLLASSQSKVSLPTFGTFVTAEEQLLVLTDVLECFHLFIQLLCVATMSKSSNSLVRNEN